MNSHNGFYAYPSNPSIVGETIENAISTIAFSDNSFSIKSWQALDIVGHFVSEEILEAMGRSDFLAVEIARLNFNVTYEISKKNACV